MQALHAVGNRILKKNTQGKYSVLKELSQNSNLINDTLS